MDARAEFDDVGKKLSTYISQHCPPGSATGVGAQEASALLGELVLLDQSIVQNCNACSVASGSLMVTKFKSMIDKAIQANPHSEFARLMAVVGEPKRSAFAVGYESATAFPEESQAVLTRIQIDTKAFYYTAHRLLKVLQGLPCLGACPRMSFTGGCRLRDGKEGKQAIMFHAQGVQSLPSRPRPAAAAELARLAS
jgi:hypothetical protein